MSNFNHVIDALKGGEVIAYPTEGVFGVGCDPDNDEAIRKLLAVKNRSVQKGLILVAASYEQILPYIDTSSLSAERLIQIKGSWPGPITWVMPVSQHTSNLVTGEFNSVAVRVTDHPLVQKVCLAFGKPITSTSANLSGLPPCMTTEEVEGQLGNTGVIILEGNTGGRNKPSEIRDAQSSQILRQG
ncbi:L-threonylcarbamoyladenylate synthase [Vibrio algarum]|uniref:Threonylcarbamoyl-AMP synthase n=1 Tax=Vibrio algarum TaxID=3020714 RepID=A0ABT4YLY1_9VIBR|nr:L-threonylcarbamoyladenylate synthase [Vibrio sp. KJ40-1]MDB1122559.1 L-threonylcarbamoyladenylate synthase [Vibrio sp. KJ40-1]